MKQKEQQAANLKLKKFLSLPDEEKTEDGWIEHLRLNFKILRHLKNQTNKICKAAIDVNPLALRFVLDKTESLCLYALNKKAIVIKYIENPTEDMQLLIVKKNGHNISMIKNPSLDIWLTAVRNTDDVYKLATFIPNKNKKTTISGLIRMKRIKPIKDRMNAEFGSSDKSET